MKFSQIYISLAAENYCRTADNLMLTYTLYPFQEVQLEGHWPHLHPVLEQVVHIFHKEVRMAVIPESNLKAMAPAVPKETSSGFSSPVIIPDPGKLNLI